MPPLETILRDKNHLEDHLHPVTLNIIFKNYKTLSGCWILSFLKLQKLEISCITHSLLLTPLLARLLTFHSLAPSLTRLKTNEAANGHHLYNKNKLTGGMCFLGFRRVCSLCTLAFLLSQQVLNKHRYDTLIARYKQKACWRHR